MGDFYQQIQGVNRNPVIFPLIVLAMFIFSFAFCRLYELCYNSDKPAMGQAINFGVLIGLLYGVSYAVIQYATRNMPLNEMIVDAIFNFCLTIIVAIVISKFFKPEGTRDDTGGVTGGGKDE